MKQQRKQQSYEVRALLFVLCTFQCCSKQVQDKQVGFLQLNWLLLLFVERKEIRKFEKLMQFTTFKFIGYSQSLCFLFKYNTYLINSVGGFVWVGKNSRICSHNHIIGLLARLKSRIAQISLSWVEGVGLYQTSVVIIFLQYSIPWRYVLLNLKPHRTECDSAELNFSKPRPYIVTVLLSAEFKKEL